MTIAMWLASQNLLVPREWMHNYIIKNRYHKSLDFLIVKSHYHIPHHWNMQQKMSIFDKAYFGIIPNIKGHQSNEQDEQGCTVAMYLVLNNIQVPKQWQHDPTIKNNQGYTVAFYQALRKQIPDKCWEHNKFIRFEYNKNYFTIQNILQLNKMQVPLQWQYHYLPNSIYENTIVMEKALKGQISENNLYPPEQNNKQGNTIGILFAKRGIIPPRSYMHDVNIKNRKGDSIKTLLQQKQLPVPYHWKDDDMTIFDQACYGIVPDITGHKPEEQNEDGWTVAMILAKINGEVPEQWYHNPSIQNYYCSTVSYYLAINKVIPEERWMWNPSKQFCYSKQTIAMILASNNLTIPKYYQHDPLLKDKNFNTVGIIQASYGQVPNNNWMHNIDLKNKQQQSIYSLLIKYGYVYRNKQFKFTFKTKILNDTCNICFKDGEQEFIKSTCGNLVCTYCFKQLLRNNIYNQCPVCRQCNWYFKNNQ